jgi:hypothetical protein
MTDDLPPFDDRMNLLRYDLFFSSLVCHKKTGCAISSPSMMQNNIISKASTPTITFPKQSFGEYPQRNATK